MSASRPSVPHRTARARRRTHLGRRGCRVEGDHVGAPVDDAVRAELRRIVGADWHAAARALR